MRIEKVAYGEYDFFITILNLEIKIASLRSQFVGTDKMFLYIHFPVKEHSKIVLDLKYHTYKEIFEQSKKIIQKKMYKSSQDILETLKRMESE